MGIRPLGPAGMGCRLSLRDCGGAAPGPLQHPEEHRQALLRRAASPAAGAIVASTVFYYPTGFQTKPQAYLAVLLFIVPALLMVSTIRFRSFKTIDVGVRRRYQSSDRAGRRPGVAGHVPARGAAGDGLPLFRLAGFIGLAAAQAARPRARGYAAGGTVGRVIVTVVPLPRSLSTVIVPPWSSTLRFAMVRPSPVPLARVEK